MTARTPISRLLRYFGALLLLARRTSALPILEECLFSSTCNNDLATRTPLFSEAMLPISQLGNENVPGLGRLMMLNTYMGPKSVGAMGTSFDIHTKGRSVRGIKFQPASLQAGHHPFDLNQMAESGFNIHRRTLVMIPGYRSDENASWVVEATQGWLELHGDNINVIVVSWADSNQGVYSQAVATTTIVARQLTIFLNYLIRISNASIFSQSVLNNIHLVGHSLGAHIAGFVGQDFGGRLGRITGLDPAGPTFDAFPRTQRLDRSDARLVEVLHTNSGKMDYWKVLAGVPLMALGSLWAGAGNSDEAHGDNSAGLATSGLSTDSRKSTSDQLTAWFGIDAQVGHVDYYANDGSEQPGCTSKTHICDHKRAAEIYVDMLRYEVLLRDQKIPRTNSLMAFRAASYESFETGESFGLACSEMLCTRDHLNQCRQEQLRAKCGIPLLDFMRPLPVLMEELKNKHGINFEPDARPEDQPRFYFKTTAGSMLSGSKNYFVGDHHMLRIYLDVRGGKLDEVFSWHEPTSDASSYCSLRVQMTMNTGEMVTMHMGHLRPTQVDLAAEGEAKQWMVAIPFVHPSGSEARAQLERLISLGLNEEQQVEGQFPDRLASAEFSTSFRKLFPQTILLTVSESKPNSGPPERPTCRMDLKAVEVHPLDGRFQNIGAIFGYRLALADRLPIVTSGQLVKELEHALEFEGFMATRLASSGKGVKSIGGGLEAVLVEK